MYEDIYFLNAQEALKTASKQNRFGNDEKLQVCYYDGDYIDSDLVNLIHLPVDDLLEGLTKGKYRVPTEVNLNGLELSSIVKASLISNFNISLQEAQRYRDQYNKHYFQTLKQAKLNFNEPLRFYLSSSASTQVMQHVSKDIADVLSAAGYEVLLNIYYGIEDEKCLKEICVFNPHVTININHLSNTFLNDECFNFVWFQDSPLILSLKEPVLIRDRDFLFTYQTFFIDLLIKKGIKRQKIFEQNVIPVNTENFYYNSKIRQENKIIFVGTYYNNHISAEVKNTNIDTKIKLLINNKKNLSYENIKKIFIEENIYAENEEFYFNNIQQAYIRNTCIEWLSDYKDFEIYGYNWEKHKNKQILDKFKGKIEKHDLNNLYNSAKYILSASGQVLNTQRLGEIVHAGAIPVVFDSRDISDEKEKWDDECLYFKTQEELNYILDNQLEPKKNRSKKMFDYFTYDKFINTILQQIDLKINK